MFPFGLSEVSLSLQLNDESGVRVRLDFHYPGEIVKLIAERHARMNLKCEFLLPLGAS